MTQPRATQPVTALIMAGQRSGEADIVAAHTGVALKAFTPIHERTMLSHVIDNLVACPAIDTIMIAMPADIDPETHAPDIAARIRDHNITRIDVGETPAATVQKALNTQNVPAGRLLITTADHPLLSADMLTTFINEWQSDVALGVVSLDDLRAKFPEQRRTRLRFSDGMYKGCNLFGLDTRGDGINEMLTFWRKLEGLRKKPLAMARTIGTGTAVLYALRLLSLQGALDHIGKQVGMQVQPVRLGEAEAAIDVDTVNDLEFVRAELADTSRDAA